MDTLIHLPSKKLSLCHFQCCFQVCMVAFNGSISILANIWEILIPDHPHFAFWHPFWHNIQPKCLNIWNPLHKSFSIGLHYIMHDTLHIFLNLYSDEHILDFNVRLPLPSFFYMPKVEKYLCVWPYFPTSKEDIINIIQ